MLMRSDAVIEVWALPPHSCGLEQSNVALKLRKKSGYWDQADRSKQLRL